LGAWLRLTVAGSASWSITFGGRTMALKVEIKRSCIEGKWVLRVGDISMCRTTYSLTLEEVLDGIAREMRSLAK